MKIFSAAELRNVAVVGHNTVGKTTLVAALLHAAGAITRAGRIEDGTCPTDFDGEELERKISINLACAHAVHRDVRINLLDAPGYGIFAPEARAAVAAADAALIVLDAVSGVEVRRRVRTARPLRHQPHGPRAGILRPGDGFAPQEVRP